MPQKTASPTLTDALSSRESIERRLSELREILSIDQSAVPSEQLANHVQERLAAQSEIPRLEAVLLELDRRAQIESNEAARQATEAEIAALDEQIEAFESTLPAAYDEIRAAARQYAALLSKVIAAGRSANAQKARRFELQLSLEGRSIRLGDIVPRAIHLPDYPSVLTLNYAPKNDLAVAMGSPWNIGGEAIDKILQDRAIE